MTSKQELAVPATSLWLETGVRVERGKRVTVKYLRGKWTANPATGLVTPAGNPEFVAKPGYNYPGVFEGILIGRVIGGEGEANEFIIGRDATVVPTSVAGELQLSINDDMFQRYGDGFSDNQGEIVVEVTEESG